jgi:hypothetical protein
VPLLHSVDGLLLVPAQLCKLGPWSCWANTPCPLLLLLGRRRRVLLLLKLLKLLLRPCYWLLPMLHALVGHLLLLLLA